MEALTDNPEKHKNARGVCTLRALISIIFTIRSLKLTFKLAIKWLFFNVLGIILLGLDAPHRAVECLAFNRRMSRYIQLFGVSALSKALGSRKKLSSYPLLSRICGDVYAGKIHILSGTSYRLCLDRYESL